MDRETVDITSRSKEGKNPEGTKILGSSVKILWLMLIKPIEDYLVEKRCHPDALTYTTLIVSAAAGLMFSKGFVFLAGVLLLAGSTADIFDGRLARALGVSSPRGAFLDSCVDRVAEVLVYLGVMSLLRDSGYIYIILLVVGSSVFVSYIRARAEGLGIRCDMGLMQRTERVVYLGVASLLNFIVDWLARPFGFTGENYGVKLALLALLAFSIYTAFERVRHTLREIEAASSGPPAGANPWKTPDS
ncbi:MAG: CDP-alcohol phosphatidyltransferase family protein [Candidatus Dadabacteria bacterium]|nr:CDP-alcohol phosphatidyltransferase family protein [Candidatus Dadabacteria bacterium]